MKMAKSTLEKFTILPGTTRFTRFYDSRFRNCDESFRSRQEKLLLSGDGRAVFEVMLHGGLWKRGSRFKSSRFVGYRSNYALKW